MTDQFTNQLLVALIITILGHAITIIVKSPKEAIQKLTGEVEGLRQAQTISTERWARHDEINKGLDASVKSLAARIDRLEPYVSKSNGPRRGG